VPPATAALRSVESDASIRAPEHEPSHAHERRLSKLEAMEDDERRTRPFGLPTSLIAAALVATGSFLSGVGSRQAAPQLEPAAVSVRPDIAPGSWAAGPEASSPVRVRHPGEFEPQRALILSAADALDHAPELLLAIVKAVAPRVGVILLVDDVEQERSLRPLLLQGGVETSRVVTLRIAHDTPWVRDYGPVFVQRAGPGCTLLDFLYDRAEDAPGDVRENDEEVPIALGGLFGRPTVSIALALDGGNFLSNGDGFGVTTTDTLEENAALGIDAITVDRVLVRALGLDSVAFLDVLAGEPTRHVDMFMTFPAPNVAVVARVDPAADPVNARILDRNAAILGRVKTRYGPMRILRVPMPLRTHGKWRSYTNVIYANGVLLVPSYRDVPPEIEIAAVDVYRNLLPDWRIERIDCTDVIEDEGALHCLAINVPWCMPWAAWTAGGGGATAAGDRVEPVLRRDLRPVR